jgi:hypothetical protein
MTDKKSGVFFPQKAYHKFRHWQLPYRPYCHHLKDTGMPLMACDNAKVMISIPFITNKRLALPTRVFFVWILTILVSLPHIFGDDDTVDTMGSAAAGLPPPDDLEAPKRARLAYKPWYTRPNSTG